MSVTVQSVPAYVRPVLLAFLKDWDAWAKGAPWKRRQWDTRDSSGLCLSWSLWAGLTWPDVGVWAQPSLYDLFEENGLDRYYPFNRDNKAYAREVTPRKNKKRRQFVRDAIAALEEALA